MTNRILTTHAGSLPRPAALVELLAARSRGEHVDGEELALRITAATQEVVAKQMAAGIDIVNDGEQARESFFTYVQHRMDGFGGGWQRGMMKDLFLYPSFVEIRRRTVAAQGVSLGRVPQAIGPIVYSDAGRRAFEQEATAFDSAVAAAGSSFSGTFMTAPSPGIIACAMQDTHYGSLEAYTDAVADALAEEYRAIAARGYILQVDAPDLAMERHTLFAERPLHEFIAYIDHTIAAINRATAGIPPERIRLHVCWGNYEGPHVFDVPLEELLPSLYRADVGALLLSMANPRHEHEYRAFASQPLPAGMDLIAGVIDTTTNYVEHPEVVADRLERVANAIGDPTRLTAGTDCGFDTAAGFGMVAEEICWAKLGALAEGAALASKRLSGA